MKTLCVEAEVCQKRVHNDHERQSYNAVYLQSFFAFFYESERGEAVLAQGQFEEGRGLQVVPGEDPVVHVEDEADQQRRHPVAPVAQCVPHSQPQQLGRQLHQVKSEGNFDGSSQLAELASLDQQSHDYSPNYGHCNICDPKDDRACISHCFSSIF